MEHRDELANDCGGEYCAPCKDCTDGIKNRDETGIDCGGFWCEACKTTTDTVSAGADFVHSEYGEHADTAPPILALLDGNGPEPADNDLEDANGDTEDKLPAEQKQKASVGQIAVIVIISVIATMLLGGLVVNSSERGCLASRSQASDPDIITNAAGTGVRRVSDPDYQPASYSSLTDFV